MKKLLTILLFANITIFCVNCPVFGQDPQNKNQNVSEELEKLKQELQLLISQQDIKIQELEKLITELKNKLSEQEMEDELQLLLEEASQLSTQEPEETENVSKRFSTGIRQLQAFNPNITMTGDFYGGVSSSKSELITEEINESAYPNNNFILREVEVSLQAALDPFTRGKSYFVFSEEEIGVEEAYLDWLNLPLKSNVKVGLFRPEFGILNKWHPHALPQFDKPRVLANYFSVEGLKGFGIETNFVLPSMFADVQTLDLSVIKGGSGFSFAEEGKYRFVYTGYLKNYYDITNDTYFEWILSGAAGHNDNDENFVSYVGGLGMVVKWTPALRTLYRSVDWKTEFILSKRETLGPDIDTFGFYTSLQNRLNRRFVLGGRIGYSELPSDSEQSEWDFRINLDFWQSEFVFVRFQYGYTERDIFVDGEPVPDDNSFTFQFVWAMGPHKHEAY